MKGLDAIDFSGIGNLGISVSVKIPKPILQAAKEIPEINHTLDRTRAAIDASAITSQSVAMLAVMGAVIVVLLYREGRKKQG